MLKIANCHLSLCVCLLPAKLLQSCLTLCNPMNCSLPGSSVHGILQARTLEWVAMTFSRGSSRPRDRTHITYTSCIGRWILFHEGHLGSPQYFCNSNSKDTWPQSIVANIKMMKKSAVSWELPNVTEGHEVTRIWWKMVLVDLLKAG